MRKIIQTDSRLIAFFLIIFSLFLYVIYVFFLKALLYIDLDFGWQIRMGKFILEHGIPRSDPFTYTMPSYPYIDHEWITSILFYLSQKYLGISGLAFVIIATVFASIFLQINKRFSLWTFLPLLLSCVALLTFFGIRAQVLGWIFFSLIIKVIFDYNLWKKCKLFVPLILLLWVNTHGSFVMGLIMITGLVLNITWQKKLTKLDLLVFILSFVVTFINPYGYQVWGEIIAHLVDTNGKNHIGEWMPLLYFINHQTLFYLFCIIVSYSVILLSRSKIELYKLILLTSMAFASFTSIRHIPFYVLLSLPLLTDSIYFIKKNAYKNKIILKTIFSTILLISLLISLIEITNVEIFVKTVQEKKAYPVNAIEYLRKNLPQKQIMSIWEWGGYLSWKLPEKKVFIDGRTLVWKWNKNKKNESNNIYKENELILQGKISLSKTVKKYNIDTLLFPVQLETDKILKKQIEKDGWVLKYKDSIAVIYQKL